MTIKQLAGALLIALAALFSSCGGGFGDPPATPSNNWDSMVWDQGKWG